MTNVTTVAIATLPIKKSADKKNVPAVIKQLTAKKPTDVPVKKIEDAAPVTKAQVVRPSATHKTLENKIERAKLKIVPTTTKADIIAAIPPTPKVVVINDDIAKRNEAFEKEYARLEAETTGNEIINAALPAPNVEKLGKKLDKLTDKTTAAKKKLDAATKETVLPTYDDSAMEFTPADFFRIKRIVEALAKKPNLLQFLAENM